MRSATHGQIDQRKVPAEKQSYEFVPQYETNYPTQPQQPQQQQLPQRQQQQQQQHQQQQQPVTFSENEAEEEEEIPRKSVKMAEMQSSPLPLSLPLPQQLPRPSTPTTILTSNLSQQQPQQGLTIQEREPISISVPTGRSSTRQRSSPPSSSSSSTSSSTSSTSIYTTTPASLPSAPYHQIEVEVDVGGDVGGGYQYRSQEGYGSGTDPSDSVRHLRQQINDLLQTGLYSNENDPVIIALQQELSSVEGLIAGLRR